MTGERAEVELNELELPFKFSDDLMAEMAELTPKQQRAIPIFLLNEMVGKNRLPLFGKGPKYITTQSTWYTTWGNDQRFTSTLKRARSEYLQGVMQASLEIAAAELRRVSPDAVRLLAKTIANAREISENLDIYATLTNIITGADVTDKDKMTAARALTEILKAGIGAANSLLDRADVLTAIKGMGSGNDDLKNLIDKYIAAGEPKKKEE